MCKRKIKAVVIGLFLIAAFAGIIYAAGEASSPSFNNEFDTSGINVKIEQYHKTDGKIEKISSISPINTGDVISCIPRVTNMGADCYIRVRVNKPRGAYEGLSDDWIIKGDMLYYKEILPPGEAVDVFDGIKIPADFESSQYTIETVVEAVQAKNFKPSFTSSDPWEGVEIELAKTVGAELPKEEPAATFKPFKLEYLEEGIYECSTSDLFNNFGSLMPGDTARESLTLRNRSENDMEISFRTENTRTQLLDTMNLKLNFDDTSIYEGPLSSPDLTDFKRLGIVKKKSSGELSFEISLPITAGNEFSYMEDGVKWIISVKEINKDIGANTGDNISFIAIAIVALALSVATLTIIARRRKDNV